jgi:hypothetical protein
MRGDGMAVTEERVTRTWFVVAESAADAEREMFRHFGMPFNDMADLRVHDTLEGAQNLVNDRYSYYSGYPIHKVGLTVERVAE